MTTRASSSRTPEPASFRDPEARVVYSADGEVLRELSPRGREDWDALESARFFRRALEDGRIVATEEVEPGVLRHERLPFVSYPYEWPFEMLRDAALLQLGLLDEALDEGLRCSRTARRTTSSGAARSRCSSTSARSSACARVSRGPATGSSARSSSIR